MGGEILQRKRVVRQRKGRQDASPKGRWVGRKHSEIPTMTMEIDSAQITSVRKAELTMYESLSLWTQKSVRCPY